MTLLETTTPPTAGAVLAVRYRDVLRVPYAVRLLAGTLIARLPVGMAPLGILLLAARGADFGSGSALAALYLVASAAGGPAAGRLVDRYGQARALTATAAVSSAAFLALATGLRQPWWAMVAVIVAGAARPPAEASLRALWGTVMPTREHLRVTLALDSASQELIYIAGPLLVAGVAGAASVYWALLTAAAFGVVGTALVVTTPPSRSWIPAPAPGRSDWLGPLRSRPLRALYLGMVCIGVPIGALNTLALKAADDFQDPGLSGALPAALSVGAFLGGLAYGARSWRGTTGHHLIVLSGAFAAGWLPLLVAGSSAAATAAAAVPGLFMAPLFSTAFLATSALAPRRSVTEANALLVAAADIGCAIGTAAAGQPLGEVLLPAAAAAASLILFTARRHFTAGHRPCPSRQPGELLWRGPEPSSALPEGQEAPHL